MTNILDKIKAFDFKRYFKDHAYSIVAYLGLIAVLIVFTILPPIVTGANIWSKLSLQITIEQITVYMILALGATMIYSMGSMDISVGYQVAVYCTLFIIISNAANSLILGILVVLVLGLICAVFNAVVGTYIKLPTVMSSVILMQMFRGINQLFFTDSSIVSYALNVDLSLVSSTWFRVLSMVILAIIACYILNFTKVGKRAKAIGANKRAAAQAGSKMLLTRISAYGVFSIFLVIASIFLVARTNSIGESDSASFQMDIMIMLLMGGMPLSGGMKTKISCAVCGCLTYTLLNRGLGLCRCPAEYITLIKAIIFLAIVIITCRKPGVVLPR